MFLSRSQTHAAVAVCRNRHGALFLAGPRVELESPPHHYFLQRPYQQLNSFHPRKKHYFHHYRAAARMRTAVSMPFICRNGEVASPSTSSIGIGRGRNLSTLRAQSCNDEVEHQQQYIELPQKSGDRNGLLRYVVLADDGHPLRLYARAPSQRHHQHYYRTGDNANGSRKNCDSGFNTYNYALLSASMEFNSTTENISDMQPQQQQQRSILLLHGRTWSSQPVFDLRTTDEDDKRQSTLQSLADLGFAAYALDLRGFGETPRDYRYDDDDDDDDGDQVDDRTDGHLVSNQQRRSGGYTTPMRCVADVKCAIDWITKRHSSCATTAAANIEDTKGDVSNMSINTKPALLGWSQGALVAQMYAQLHGPTTLSDLILFGSIYDPKTIYPRKPLYHNFDVSYAEQRRMMGAPENSNTVVAALEDFTLPGTICDEAASAFSTLALEVDPIKVAWDDLHEFNICNPALVHVPTLVMAGSQDPYVSWDAQRELFDRLGTEDKAMCILPGCDHAAHILKARRMFIRAVAGFLLRKDDF